MDKVYELKVYESGLGRYNATKISIICIVCDSYDEAIGHVLTPDTITVELVSVKPCLVFR